MKGLVLDKNLKELKFKSIKEKTQIESVKVQLLSSALNHRDVWITKGKYPGIKPDVILGSDGVGTIDGNLVLINPGLNWGANENFQSAEFNVLGLPSHGTFADSVIVPKANIVKLPIHLNEYHGAALPLAGVTAFRVLFKRCELKKNDKVLITGAGGGVSMMAIQFALAIGAEVYVTSGSEEKIKKVKEIGVNGAYNYKNENWTKEILSETGGLDVIIDSAGGNTMDNLVKIANPGCRIGFYGSGKGSWSIKTPGILFWRQISLLGSTMGSPKDFEEMIKFVTDNTITPIIEEVLPLKEFEKGFSMMDNAEQYGKIVFDNSRF